MKQILQNISNGETQLVDVPCPKVDKGSIVIATRNSLVSAGTERMLVDFGKANYLSKARQQPDKVKMAIDKVRTDGLLPTIDAIRSKLDQPLPLGYCNAGIVLESGVADIKKGDRVVSNGYHAEVVRVPKNLCVKIPDEVDDESAAFTVLAAIGLQGIRLTQPTLGEAVAVFGLGLIGLLTVQMLRANGCRVLGIDFDTSRCEQAKEYGADVVDLSRGEDPLAAAEAFSRSRGVDAVIIAASTQSDEVMHQAAQICRQRGRVVLIGVVGLDLRRDDFYKKEITFQVSASYGPGRYDPAYEEQGQDYPVGFVRWTEQRNFEAVLDMMANGVLDVKPLISHRFSIDRADEAYEVLGQSSTLGILIEYPKVEGDILSSPIVKLQSTSSAASSHVGTGSPVVGFIGAGNYASRILIPAFKLAGARLQTLVTKSGISGVHHGKKSGFAITATDLNAVWQDESINIVVIATRHNEHAEQVCAALESGKHVFVEKPLALTLEQLNEIDAVYKYVNKERRDPLQLMVGFNRRFAPLIVKMKALLSAKREPKSIVMTVNAGSIPREHWTQDINIGGGRIIGEGCHFIDLMRFLIGAPIVAHQSVMMGSAAGVYVREDKATITLSFADGSFGTIHYLANGGRVFPKERIEVFCGDAVLQMDNFRVLKGYGWTNFGSKRQLKQDKGQRACARAFLDGISKEGLSPICYEDLMESSLTSIEVAEALRRG